MRWRPARSAADADQRRRRPRTPPPEGSPLHGTVTGYSYGCRCAECALAQQVYAQLAAQRRRLGSAELSAAQRRHGGQSQTARRARSLESATRLAGVITRVRRCGDVVAAAQEMGITAHEVRGVASWCGPYREALDAALRAGCRAKLVGRCGTPSGYRAHGGRCPDCQAAHRGRAEG